MSFPSFVIEQLLARFSSINPSVGDYFSHTFSGSHALVLTTSGKIEIPESVLQKQFENPQLLEESEIEVLVSQFS